MLDPDAKINISLAKAISIIISIVGLSFLVGSTYQGMLPDREAQKLQIEKIQKIEITLERVTTVLEKMESRTNDHERSLLNIESKIGHINGQVVVLDSYMRDRAK
jgi:hypothetical protein